jgi:hypothetical protein
MLRLGLQQLIERLKPHPGDSLLVSLHDNELSPSRRSRVLTHLKKCRHCRDRLMQIDLDWRQLEELRLAANRQPLSDTELISGIQASIHACSEATPQPASQEDLEKVQAETNCNVAAALGVYIGRRAADAMVRANGTSLFSNRKNLASAQSTLRILIGRKSAAAIETKLHRIMNRMPESAGRSSVS